jgi:hypothetical protein
LWRHYTDRVHGRAAQVWQATHRHELERRREQRSQRHRGLLRTVMRGRGRREEADGAVLEGAVRPLKTG